MESGKGLVTKSTEVRKEQITKSDAVGESVPHPEGSGPSPAAEILARVKYAEGTTIELRRFEFQRIDVGLEMPSRIGKLNETFEFVKTWVEDRLTVEVEKVIATRDGAK
jgi:hypothetical protein